MEPIKCFECNKETNSKGKNHINHFYDYSTGIGEPMCHLCSERCVDHHSVRTWIEKHKTLPTHAREMIIKKYGSVDFRV